MGKCKCPPAGAPEWVLTYGDLMSLLLCFFILLAALSELKKNEPRPPASENKTKTKASAATGNSILEGGPVGTQGFTEANNSFIPLLEVLAAQRAIDRRRKEDADLKAEQPDVTTLRPDRMYQIGKSILFDPHHARPDEEALEEVRRAAVLLRGYNTGIEIRGHASILESENDGAKQDLWHLSYERARRVTDLLISPELGISRDRIKISCVGPSEPVVTARHTHDQHRQNRRVDILLINQSASQTVLHTP